VSDVYYTYSLGRICAWYQRGMGVRGGQRRYSILLYAYYLATWRSQIRILFGASSFANTLICKNRGPKFALFGT